MFETLYSEIHSLTDLKPNPKINSVFSKLYQSVISSDIWCVFCWEKKHTIQNICAEAEYEMEKYYAEKIINSELKIEDFIYIENYEKLALIEIESIKNQWIIPEKILYIWGWPLPLSAIFYAKFTQSKITILDNSLEAIQLGKQIIKILWLSDQISYEYWDANNYTSKQKYDFVSVASLVFTHSKIENILANIQKLSFEILHLRSAEWAREILYKKLPTNILEKYFTLVFQYHPQDEIINSIILLKKYE